MTILVIDGQGGRLGAQLVRAAAERLPQAELVCVGTNALATGAMLKAGAARGATGENAVLVLQGCLSGVSGERVGGRRGCI